MSIIVSKAGGTSHATPEAFELSMEWAEDSAAMIVSAPGKIDETFSGNKVTKQLLAAYDGEVDEATAGSSIQDRFDHIVTGLSLKMPQGWIDSIPARVKSYMDSERFTSTTIGELLTAEIYEASDYRLIDPGKARRVIGTDPDLWHQWLESELRAYRGKIVIPGNRTTGEHGLESMGEGGSDYAAGLISYAMGADLHRNLTDGPARSADPKRFVGEEQRLKVIEHLTYDELIELGKNGTGLVHPDAALPLGRVLGIPTEVRSTFDKNGPITLLDNDRERADIRAGNPVALSIMNNIVIVDVHGRGIASDIGPLAMYDRALKDAEIPIIDSKGYGFDFQRYFLHGQHGETGARELEKLIGKDGGSIEVSKPKDFITIVGYLMGLRGLDHEINFATNSGVSIKGWQSGGNDKSVGKHSLRVTVDPGDTHEVFDNLHRSFIE